MKEKIMRHIFLHTPVTTRIWSYILLGTACIVLLAACGSTTSSTGNSGAYGSGGTTPTATTVPPTATSASSGGAYGGGSTTPTATTGSSSGNLVATTTASVSGKSETILTNAQGLTLYYRTSDVPPSNVCSGGCASAWPPLINSGTSAPTSSGSLSGKLTSITDTNGNQVEYNGHLLYTYAADTAPGQTTGQGLAGVWFVATPSLT
jgi:predicted lipoprotein with Yx(FWY)xxD motif